MPFRLRGRTGKRRMGGELRAGEVSVAVSSPAKEKCIWRTPLSRCPVQAEAFGHVSRACPCFALLYTHDAVHKAVAAAAAATAGRAGGLGGWTDSELPMTCDLLAPLGGQKGPPAQVGSFPHPLVVSSLDLPLRPGASTKKPSTSSSRDSVVPSHNPTIPMPQIARPPRGPRQAGYARL